MIKIAVAQAARQHTHLVLQVLQQKKLLSKFYTVFAADKFDALSALYPARLKKSLSKRSFPAIPSRLIAHRPDLFLKEQLGNIASEENLIQQVYAPFDSWVASKLERLKPDIFMAYENANVASFKKAKALGITTVLDLAQIHHQSILDIHTRYGFLNKSYTTQTLDFINKRKTEALHYTDYIFALSSFARDSLVANAVPPQKIFTVNLGVNQQNFYPKTSYAPKAKFRFLFVGTITRRKGLDVLFKAFKSLSLPNAELVLIGPMADGSELLEEYKDLYSYHPFMHHEALANAYRNADVFVFPSYLDSWAQTVVEAMACGTPAIVSEHTGAKDAVKQGGGFVVPVGDIAALKEKMLYCYQNPEEVKDLGKTAAKIATQYTTENYHQQVIEAVNKIANEQNKG